MKRFEPHFWLRSIIAAIAILLVFLRAIYFESVGEYMDSIFFAVIGFAAIIMVLPIDRLTSFKAGSFEFSLDAPQVKAALKGLGLDQSKNEQLGNMLSHNEVVPLLWTVWQRS